MRKARGEVTGPFVLPKPAGFSGGPPQRTVREKWPVFGLRRGGVDGGGVVALLYPLLDFKHHALLAVELADLFL